MGKFLLSKPADDHGRAPESTAAETYSEFMARSAIAVV